MKNEVINNRSRLLQKLGLNENEFHLMCDLMNGIMPDLSYLNCKERFMDNIFGNENNEEIFKKWEVDFGLLNLKIFNLSYRDMLELISEIDVFWDVEDSMYSYFDKVTPKQVLHEYELFHELNNDEGNVSLETIIWKFGGGSMDEFFRHANDMGFKHILYVQDSEGNEKCVWATTTHDLIDSLKTLSDKCFFARYQSLERAIQYGFDDEIRNN